MSLALATLVQLTILSAPTGEDEAETYAAAYRQNAETGRPLVVLVGATWCPACMQMKRTVVPQLRQSGILQRVAFAHVDLDREKELGQKLTGGGAIPQLIVCRNTSEGWHRERLVGARSVQTVEQLLLREISAGQAIQKPEALGDTGQPIEKPTRDS